MAATPDAFRILAVPLWTETALTHDQERAVAATVHDTDDGYRCLHPTNVAALCKTTGAGLREVRHRLLWNLVNAESAIIARLIGQKSETPASTFGDTVFDAILGGARERPAEYRQPKGMSDRVTDLYRRDVENLLGPDVEHKSGVTASLPTVTSTSVDYATAIVVTDAYAYHGHVYARLSSTLADAAEVVGVRTSLLNMHRRSMSRVATKIFAGVARWAQSHELKRVYILHPIGPMPEILATLAFEVPVAFSASRYMFATTEALTAALAAGGSTSFASYDDGGAECAYPYAKRRAALVESKELRAECARLADEWRVDGKRVHDCALQRYVAEPYSSRVLRYVDYLQYGYMNELFAADTRRRIEAAVNDVGNENLAQIAE